MAAPFTTHHTTNTTTMLNNAFRGEGTIVLKKQDVSVKLNMNAWRILTKDFDVDLNKIDEFLQKNQIDAICALAYCGIQSAEASKGKAWKLGYELFCAQFLEHESNIEALTELISGTTTGAEESESGNE